ncbi:ATP-binding protein [Streptomyces varsoviensis]|uniref:ATP-binding protein n=1 Tax=Streptomyces varsoviensis TaxID=67373 RepID=UPI0033F337C6
MLQNAPTPVPAKPVPTCGTPSSTWAGNGAPSGLLPPAVVAPFAFQSVPRFVQCPPPPPDLAEPSPAKLVYGLTLPSACETPTVAQEAAEVMFEVHGVEEELMDPALLLVYELTVHACRFTGAGELVQVVLRRDGNVLQVTAHDTHAPHAHRRLAIACDERRKVSLSDVCELSERHQGAWGFGAAYPPAAGVCTWATLVHGPHPSPDSEVSPG